MFSPRSHMGVKGGLVQRNSLKIIFFPQKITNFKKFILKARLVGAPLDQT